MTVVTLYEANSLLALVSKFAKVCEQSTDFHFANLEQQLEKIEQCVLEAKDWKAKKKAAAANEESDRISLKSSGSASSEVDHFDELSKIICRLKNVCKFNCNQMKTIIVKKERFKNVLQQ